MGQKVKWLAKGHMWPNLGSSNERKVKCISKVSLSSQGHFVIIYRNRETGRGLKF